MLSYLTPQSQQAAKAYQLTQRAKKGKPAPESWDRWLFELFPSYFPAPFAARHRDMWEWVESIPAEKRPPAFVGIWGRGGAKSTNAEAVAVYLGATERRKYVLYISETQEQADDHVGNIAEMLESPRFAEHYPKAADRKVGKFGNSKGWRRNRLRCANGFIVDAMGLDSARRGAKIEDARPDLIIIDDIDGQEDSKVTVDKKIRSLTQKILPAGAYNLAVLAIQNLIHPDSIFSQMYDGRADFLANRIVSGPFPAIEGLTTELRDGRYMITGGDATWEGQNLDRCQQMLDDMGLSAFLKECQHDVEAPLGGIWDHVEFKHIDFDELPDLVRVSLWVDPAVTNTDQSDNQAISISGIDEDGKMYRLFAWEQRSSPRATLRLAVLKAIEYGSLMVGVETDQGGDVWLSAYEKAVDDLVSEGLITEDQAPQFQQAKAGAGHGSKVHRNALVLADYERGNIIHVRGTHQTMERAYRRFPLTKPYDWVDASYWDWNDLRGSWYAW